MIVYAKIKFFPENISRLEKRLFKSTNNGDNN